MPRAVSILRARVSALRLTCPISPAAPDTAAMGDACAARLAGACAAKNTVTTPMTTPQRIPTQLKVKTGMYANSTPTMYLSPALSPHVTAIPSRVPTKTAILHQYRASSRTKQMIWCLLAPRQRSMPKNCILWATLLFMLLVIIRTPATRIIRNSRPARGYTFWIYVLLLIPFDAMRSVLNFMSSSARPYCAWISSIAFFNFVCSLNWM